MQQYIRSIGNTNWSNADIEAELDTFTELYHRRPIQQNDGGMKAPHMLGLWFMLRQLRPKNVIESGVWRGQSTWLIEQALPDAHIFSIDINFKNLQYRSARAKYFDVDFSKIDWVAEMDDLTDCVLFFDDHQNAVERVRQAQHLGFRHLIFEDNYPAGTGDCYSLKKAFMHGGHTPVLLRDWKSVLKRTLGMEQPAAAIPPNADDMAWLQSVLSVYYEFPPVYQLPKTRWGADWNDAALPTPPPVLSGPAHTPAQQLLRDEAADYTWICYAQL
jgi:hypothetical protein